jgi:SAM-dependent methyltransferase
MERLRAHYEVERELADRLRAADRKGRARLYAEVYDELFARVPDHPQLTNKADPALRRREIELQAQVIERFAPEGATIMEVGAGDCALLHRLAQRAARVVAVDVSETVTRAGERPENVELLLIDGCEIPAEPASVDLAYSNQLLEHLHPEDAEAQTRDILRALRPGGTYICITPARLTGPHDISYFFDRQATGFHLHEYSSGEVIELFRRAGFARVKALIVIRGRAWALPAKPLAFVERVLEALPRRLGSRIAQRTPLRKILGRTIAYPPG